MDSSIDYNGLEIWFVTGSQELYGREILRKVAENSAQILEKFNFPDPFPLKLVRKETVTSSLEIETVMREANHSGNCAGVMVWMHTFSPAKMWINGLKILQKPLLHLHTQTNRDLPWETIDMDFMNLNQSAHGDREFGFLCTRMNLPRKIAVGYPGDLKVRESIETWARVCAAVHDMRRLNVIRFGDNMRGVAVTEGDKVAAQIQFGYSVDGYPVEELTERMDSIPAREVSAKIGEYMETYRFPVKTQEVMDALTGAVRQELGFRDFLKSKGACAFTTNFENLGTLCQLPGFSVQRLMYSGFGFGAEGDWKTAALLRTMKFMAKGLPGGVSFMEDYTYHLEPGRERVLGAHMLEVCPSIAAGIPLLEVHPLGIGGKEPPARLVFDVPEGKAVNVCLIELADRFRLIVCRVNLVKPDVPLKKLPVARALWVPETGFETAERRWLELGGGHHTVLAPALTVEYLRDFAVITGCEYCEI